MLNPGAWTDTKDLRYTDSMKLTCCGGFPDWHPCRSLAGPKHQGLARWQTSAGNRDGDAVVRCASWTVRRGWPIGGSI